MKLSTYQEKAMRTAPEGCADALQHAAMGLAGEAGEFVDIVKKIIFYGKKIDRAHLQEELGDILWYAALAAQTLGFSLDDIAEHNISKLKKRYPDKFTSKDALERKDK